MVAATPLGFLWAAPGGVDAEIAWRLFGGAVAVAALVAACVQGSDAPLPLVSPNVSNTHTGEKKRAATFGERGMGAVIDKTFSSSGHPQTVSK